MSVAGNYGGLAHDELGEWEQGVEPVSKGGRKEDDKRGREE
jgi:hypothetical protein